MQKILYIIRGLPGSGKSTLAKKLTPNHFEADQYFKECGLKFDPRHLKLAHAFCQKGVECAMINNVTEIAVSNTFTRNTEKEPYVSLAEKYGYQVQEIILKSPWKSIHGVPDTTIRKMAARFEYVED